MDGRAISTFVMALPMLLAFTVFAWWPLLRAGVLSVQHSNLVDTPSFVGLENFREVLADPLLWTAVKNTAWFVFLALVFGFPIPLLLAVMMSELRRNRGLYSALAYLPVVIPPVASILLWQRFFDASPTGTFNTILGWFGLGPWPWIQDPTWAMPSIVLLATWSNAGATVIIYLAALHERARRAVRGGRGRRRVAAAQGLARHPAAAAHRAVRHDDAADRRHLPAVHRAVPAHRRADRPTRRCRSCC